MIKEIFKTVPEFPDYEVSNFGNVISNKSNKTILLKQPSSGGYYQVTLSNKEITKGFRVHQLVAIVFLNHKPNGTGQNVVDHKNCNRLDNRLENLQVLTNRENLIKDKNPKTVGTSKFKDKYYSRVWMKYNNKNINIHLGVYASEEIGTLIYKIALNNLDKFNGDRKQFRNEIKAIFSDNYIEYLI